MADNKIKIDIEAVDNFSKIIDELNKKLKQLQTKQGKIEPVRISGINKQLDELERRFDNLNRGQLARMPSDKIQYEIRSMLKQVNDLYKSVEDALNKLSTKTVNKGKNLNIAKKELVEFDGQDVVKEMKKYKDIIAKALNIEVKPTLDKKSIEDTKKKVKEEFKDNKVTQKVTVETETRAKDTTKEKVKPTETKTKKETVEEEKPKRGRKKKEEAPKIETPQQQTVAQTVKTEVKAEVDKSSVQKAVKDIQKEVSSKPVKFSLKKSDKKLKEYPNFYYDVVEAKNKLKFHKFKEDRFREEYLTSLGTIRKNKQDAAIARLPYGAREFFNVAYTHARRYQPHSRKPNPLWSEDAEQIVKEKRKQFALKDLVGVHYNDFRSLANGWSANYPQHLNFASTLGMDSFTFKNGLDLDKWFAFLVHEAVVGDKPSLKGLNPKRKLTKYTQGEQQKQEQEELKLTRNFNKLQGTGRQRKKEAPAKQEVEEVIEQKTNKRKLSKMPSNLTQVKKPVVEEATNTVMNKEQLAKTVTTALLGDMLSKNDIADIKNSLLQKALGSSVPQQEQKKPIEAIADKKVQIPAEVKVDKPSVAKAVKEAQEAVKTISIEEKPKQADFSDAVERKLRARAYANQAFGIKSSTGQLGEKAYRNFIKSALNDDTIDKDAFRQKLKELEDKAKVDVKPQVKKENIQEVQKQTQKELDKKPVEQKVNLEKKPKQAEQLSLFDEKSPTIAQKRDSSKKAQEVVKKALPTKEAVNTASKTVASLSGKITVDETALSKSLDNVLKNINKEPRTIKLGKDEKYFKKVLSDNVKAVNKDPLKLRAIINSINIDKSEKDRLVEKPIRFKGEVKPYSVADTNSIKPLKLGVNEKTLLSSIKVAIGNINKEHLVFKIGKDEQYFNKIIDANIKKVSNNVIKFKAEIGRIGFNKDKLNEFKENHTITIPAVIKNIKLNVDTGKLVTKMQSIVNHINVINRKKIDITTSQSEDRLVRLSTMLNQLKAKDYNYTISVQTKESREKLKDIADDLKSIPKTVKINIDTSGIRGQSTQIRTLANSLKNIDKVLSKFKSGSIKIDFNAGKLANIVRTVRNLNRELQNVKDNVIINITVNDHDSINRLREVSRLLRDIRRNRNINISTHTRNSGSGGSGSRGSQTQRIGQEQGGVFGFLSNLFGGTTAFVGRALKGTGSFLEAVSKATMAVGRLGQVGLAISVVVGGITAAASALVGVFTAVSNAAQILGNILITVGRTIFQVLQPGIELYKQQQHAIFSFTAALQTHGVLDENVPNVGGQRLSAMGDEGREIARGLSAELIQRATLDAEMSAFSLEELLRSMQGTLPLLLSRGMSLDQAYEVNKGVAGVAKMTQLSPNQILQETRDLAQGTISSRSSQVANALGISSADIEKYKGDAEGLFNFLMERFKAYGEMLAEFEDTAIGRWQQLQERYQNVTKNIVEGIAPMFKGVFEEIIAWTGEWKDKNGNYLDAIAGVWKDKNGEIIGTIKEVTEAQDHLGVDTASAKFIPSEELQKIKQALIEIIVYVAGILDAFIAWGRELLGTTDPINLIKQLILDIVQAFMLCVSILGAFIQNFATIYATAIEFVDTILSVVQALIFIKSIFKGIGLFLVNIVKLSISVFRIFTNLGQLLMDNITPLVHALYDNIYNIVRMVKAIMSGDISGAASIGLEVANNVKNQYKESITTDINDIISSIDSGIDAVKGIFVDPVKSGIEGGMQYLQVENLRKKLEGVNTWDKVLGTVSGFQPINGKWQQAVTKYTEASEKAKQQASSGGVKATDVRGIPKEDDKNAAKEAKKALKEAQKALKEELQRLKEELKDKLDELKDAQERDDIAYKEGFMSMKDYFTNKALREQEEARLRLEEAVAERDLIDKTPFESEYDRQKELHKVNREIREYTRALEKSNRQLGEVTNQIGKYNQSMKVMQELQRQPIQTMMYGGQQAGMGGTLSVTGQQALEQWGEKNGIAGWIVDEVINRGVNTWGRSAATEKLIKLTLAAMKQESGGSQNAISPAGAIGLMQLMPETAAGLGVNPYDWSENIFGGMKYYHQQLETFGGSIEKALAAYNAGPGAVQKYGGVPPYRETQNYVRIIKGTFDEMKNFPKLFDNRVGQIATSLGVTVNDVNKELGRLGQAIETLVSSTGELLGYKAPQQYSRGGIDTRFSTFDEGMSGGVDAQIAGLKPQVIMAINAIAKEFFEKTGRKIRWTSFTGSNLHATGEWGHYAGWKGDADVEPRDYPVLKQVLGRKGIGAGVEDFGGDNQHVDISFAKGGVGGDILTTLTGTAFYNKLNNAVTSNGINVLLPQEQKKEIISDEFRNKIASDLGVASDKKMQDLFDSIYQANPDTTKGGYELRNERFDRLQKLWELRAKNTSRVAGNTQEARMVLMIKYLRQMSEARSDPEMYNELDLAHQLEELDLVTEQLSKFADINLADIENKLKLDDYRLQLGEIDATSVASRIAQALTDKNDPLGLAKTIEDLEKQYADYISRGAREDAQRVQSKLQSIRKTVLDYFDKLRESVVQPWDMSQKIFNAMSKYTSTQREFAEREFTAHRSQAELAVVDLRISEANVELEKTTQNITRLQDKLNSLNADNVAAEMANLKESQAGLNLELENEKKLYDDLQKKLNEYDKVNKEIAKTKAELESAQNLEKTIQLQQKLNLQQKELLEIQKQMPNYLKDIQDAANEALDKGLNEMLTDGVNSAKSLGELLKDLAVTVLKEIQRVSAKWMVKNIMNKLVGHFYVDEKGNSQMALLSTTQALVKSNYDLLATNQALVQTLGGTIGNEFGTIPQQSTQFKSVNGILDVNNPFESPWQQSSLNPNAQSPQQQYTFNTPNILDTVSLPENVKNFNVALGEASTNKLPGFNTEIENVANSLTKGNSLESATQQISTQTSTVFSNILTQLQQAGMSIVMELNRIATQLRNITFGGSNNSAYTGGLVKGGRILRLAKGGAVYKNTGLVRGTGTSTSDDIPAMLSNGEAVLNAKAVKKLGVNFISAVNNGEFSKIRATLPHFAEGGFVGEAQQSTARGMTDFAKGVGSEVHTTNNMNIALVRDEQEAIREWAKNPNGGKRFVIDMMRQAGVIQARF